MASRSEYEIIQQIWDDEFQSECDALFTRAKADFELDDVLFFSVDWVADRLREIAKNETLDNKSVLIIQAIHDALLWKKREGQWQLKIVSRTAGKRKTRPEAQAIIDESELVILELVDMLTELLGKKEAAVAMVQEKFHISRAKIFGMMARAKRNGGES